ncbi:MAG TPA: adenosine deaminase [Candidatus Onthocola stercoravium]|nr:adenosine deaminase [Candidatus Onthocola stercoravium]
MIVKDMPKIVLHLHLDGSIDMEDAYLWAKEDGLKITKKELEQELQVNDDCHNLNDYLEKFDLPCKLLQTCERLEKTSYHLFLKLSKMNVKYAEVRFAPNKHLAKNLTLDDVVISVINGMNKANVETGIMGGIILSMMRGDSKEDNIRVINLAQKYLKKGVVAIDLAGAEAIYPTIDYIDLFRYAKIKGIPFTIHAGEAAGVESIKAALDAGAKRIGHGIRAIDDEAIQKIIIDKQVLLEVCMTSNYQTEAVKGKHPIEKLYNNGIKISINTDNDTVSNIDINKEYTKILNETDLTMDDLGKCNKESIDYIFADQVVKDKLQKEFEL